MLSYGWGINFYGASHIQSINRSVKHQNRSPISGHKCKYGWALWWTGSKTFRKDGSQRSRVWNRESFEGFNILHENGGSVYVKEGDVRIC